MFLGFLVWILVSLTYFQDKSPLKQVTEKPESSNMPESRQTAEDDTRHTNKACKRVSKELYDSFLFQVYVTSYVSSDNLW